MPSEANHFEPLDSHEIDTVAHVTREYFGALGNTLRFNSISLLEPFLYHERTAHVVVQIPEKAIAHSLHVSVESSKVLRTEDLHGAQPPLSPDDCDLATAIVKKDPKLLALLKSRHGIHRADAFRADPWSVNIAGGADELSKWQEDRNPVRLVQTFLYASSGEADNQYAHPIDIVPVVDLYSERVIRILNEHADTIEVPKAEVNYNRNGINRNDYLPRSFRKPLNPLHIVQPNGTSFSVCGRKVSWAQWSFTVGFNYREGLVLHNIYCDGRPVLSRASVVEMAVPYFDPRQPFVQKCAFDVGDYGLGYCAGSLELGCDCLGSIHYMDAVLSDSKGRPYKLNKAVCIHEEDTGLAWKHMDYITRHNEARRARRLVVSFIATVVNYEYLFYFYFGLDGTLEFEIKLSGELSTNTLSPNEEYPTHGTLVAPNVNAQLHQHMFCVRLDPTVDGENNTVEQVDVIRTPRSKTNQYGNEVKVVATPLTKETSCEAAPARTWRITSNQKNRITGRPTAYKLIPGTRGGAQPALLTDDECVVTKRGKFATKSLWVTRYDAAHRFPAGEWPTQSTGAEDDVGDWVQGKYNTEGEKLSLWHSFGVMHIPRVEDFPVMPCESVGFTLKPDGFFLGNPAVNVPPETDSKSVHVECCGS